MPRARKLTVGVVVLVAGALAVAGRRASKAALARRALQRRAELAEPAPPARIATSQIGYGPAMAKQFSSPRAFDSFRVVHEPDGSPALQGGGPVGAAPGAWIGDFSRLQQPGRYRVLAAGLQSQPFDVGPGVFDAAVRLVQRSFYFQRAFTEIDRAHAQGPWVHRSDADKAPAGVAGGWHDAGDFSLYSASLNSALFWLLQAWDDFAPADDDTGIPESGNGIPDLLDEARWGLSWLLSVQDSSGGFRNTTCEARYGAYGTQTPESAAPYLNGEVGTLATARAVGNLAHGAAIWRRFDAAFADRLLAAAARGYAYLAGHPEASDGPTCPAYRADGDALMNRHVRMFAAAAMLLATGESRHAGDFDAQSVELEGDPGYQRPGGYAALLYLHAAAGAPSRKADLSARISAGGARVREAGREHAFGWSAPTHWGSIGAGFTRVAAFSIPLCLRDPAGAAADCEQALANVHYALGRNPLGLCYVSGLPGATRSRAHAFHHWWAALRADPFLPPGMVAGGPNAAPDPADASNPLARPIPIWGYFGDPAFPRDATTPVEERYTDNDSWSTNEVSLDWQASTLYALHFARFMARMALSPPAARK